MRPDLTEHRFSDDDVRRIFEEAAHSEIAEPVPAGGRRGMRLADIRAIAQEVGIEPAAVDRAAAHLVAEREGVGRREAVLSLFKPVLHEDASIPRVLSTEEMRGLAEQVEIVLGRHGALREAGDWVEWRDSRDRLYLGIVRGRASTRIRVIADHTREVIAGTAGIGFVSLMALATVLDWPGVSAFLGAVLVAVGGIGAMRLFWKWRSGVHREHLAELLDILEGSARQ